MRLRTKLFGLLVVLAVVLGVSLYGGLELYKSELVAGERTDANDTATFVAGQISAAVDEKEDLVGFVASQPEAVDSVTTDGTRGRSGYLEDFVSNSRFYAAQAVTSNGTVVAFEGDVTADTRATTLGRDVGDRRYVRAALNGKSYVSEPERTATRRHIVVISAPIVEDREVVGALVAAIYLDTGTVLTPVVPLPSETTAVQVSASSDRLYAAGPSFERPITATATTDDGWTVRVDRDRAPLDARLRDVGLMQAGGVVTMFLVVAVVGAWEYRTSIAQIGRLRRALIAASEGEYDYQLSLSGGDEWADIGDRFEELIEELSRREATLERRRQRLEVLNRVLRHNLRNDVAVIQGYAEHIDDPDADVENVAEVIQSRADALTELGEKARRTEMLMAEGVAERRRLDVGSTVLEVVGELETEFPDVDLRTEVPTSAYAVAIPQVEIAIRHVCENACEHNDAAAPRVDVRLERSGDWVTVEVADNGPGIPEYELDVLREGRETPLQHGSGLGMWLVNWAVEESEGSLSFAANEPRGTVVRMALAAADASEAANET